MNTLLFLSRDSYEDLFGNKKHSTLHFLDQYIDMKMAMATKLEIISHFL